MVARTRDRTWALAGEASTPKAALTRFSSPVATTRITQNRLAKAGGSLPPKLCCSFYSSGYSASSLTSLEIALRMRFQFSRSFGIRRTGPMIGPFAGLLFQSSPTGYFVPTRS